MRHTRPGGYSKTVKPHQKEIPHEELEMIATAYQNTAAINSTFKTQAFSHQNDKPLDLDAFNELVLAHQDAVYRQAYWILGSEEAAEDATQEAFLRAYRNLSSYSGGPFRPWVMRIAVNYCYDQLRRQKVRKTVPLDAFDENDQEIDTPSWLRDPGASIEELYEQEEEQSRIMHSIQSLAPDYRAAIILVDVQGMDYNEASAVMGVPMGTFKSRLSRARLQVQKYLRQ
jgi:RNA polymerase sigma-70 factor, ECF subfamily